MRRKNVHTKRDVRIRSSARVVLRNSDLPTCKQTNIINILKRNRQRNLLYSLRGTSSNISSKLWLTNCQSFQSECTRRYQGQNTINLRSQCLNWTVPNQKCFLPLPTAKILAPGIDRGPLLLVTAPN